MPTLEIVGLIPAGGHGTRLSPLPCSKELFPIGNYTDESGAHRPKTVSHYLLEKYKSAGITRSYFIIRKGKWDIPQYFGDGSTLGMELGYLIMNNPHGHPFTIDQAFPFTKHSRVAFGFPDILFAPEDAFVQLAQQQSRSQASVTLGMFPIREDDHKFDLASYGKSGQLERVFGPHSPGAPKLGWAIALWTPEFSAFLHAFLADLVSQNNFKASDGREYRLSHVFQAALDNGHKIDSVVFESGFAHDIGTPDDLLKAQREYSA